MTNKRCRDTREKILEPLDGAGVEMVRRLVENQKVGPGKKGAAKRDAPFFAAGKRAHDAIGFRRVQIRDERLIRCSRFHHRHGRSGRGAWRSADFRPEPFVFGDPVEDLTRTLSMFASTVVASSKPEHLWHVAGDEIAPACEFACRLRDACGNLEKGRFAGAISADKPDVFALTKGDRRAV